MVLKLAKLAFVTVGYAIVGVVAGSVTSSTPATTTNSNGGADDASPTSGEGVATGISVYRCKSLILQERLYYFGYVKYVTA